MVNCDGDAATVGVKLYKMDNPSSAIVVNTSNGREELKMISSWPLLAICIRLTSR